MIHTRLNLLPSATAAVFISVFFILLSSEGFLIRGVSSSPLPSSAWNQPGLAINTINSDSENSNGGKSRPYLSNGDSNGTNGKLRKKYSWNTLMHYGVSGNEHGIRHRSKKLKDSSQLPCPFDQIRSWDGKCRQAPRFSLYRVG
jgi:hypothetical protein